MGNNRYSFMPNGAVPDDLIANGITSNDPDPLFLYKTSKVSYLNQNGLNDLPCILEQNSRFSTDSNAILLQEFLHRILEEKLHKLSW